MKYPLFLLLVMKKVFILLVLATILITCKKEEDEGPSRQIFTLTIGSDVNLGQRQAFVIIHDFITKELIDYKSISAGQTVVFESSNIIAHDLIDVTYFTNEDRPVPGLDRITKSHSAVTYMEVKVGSEWNWTAINDNHPTLGIDGNYSIKMSGMPANYANTISDKYGILETPETNAGSILTSVRNYAGTSKHLLSVHNGSDDPKYLWIEDHQNGIEVDLDYTDMKDYDDLLTVYVPQPEPIQAAVIGLSELPSPAGLYSYNLAGYYTIAESNNINTSSLALGFLDEFPVYAVNVFTKDFSYTSVGPRPAGIPYPDMSRFQLGTKKFPSVQYSIVGGYQHKVINWSYFTYGSTISEATDFKFHSGLRLSYDYQPLPQQLIDQFSIPLENLEFESLILYIDGGDTYEDFLKLNKNSDGNTFQPAPPFIETKVILK